MNQTLTHPDSYMNVFVPVLNNDSCCIDIVRGHDQIPVSSIEWLLLTKQSRVDILQQIVPSQREPERRINKSCCVTREALLMGKVRTHLTESNHDLCRRTY